MADKPTHEELEKMNQEIGREGNEPKKIEQELLQYKSMISSSKDMIALLNTEFTYLASNDAYLSAFGITKDGVIGHTVGEVFGKEFFESVIKPHAERCMAGEDVHYSDWFDFPVYGRRYMDISYFPYLGKDKENRGFVVYGRDNTERKRTEEALQESEERFRSLSESSPMGVFHTDSEGRVLYTNNRWQEITGLTLEESLGFGWSNALHPDDKKAIIEEWGRCLSEEKGYSGEFRFVSKSEEVKWVYTKTAPIRAETGQIIGHVGSNEDITERKRKEEERKKLILLLQEALSEVKTLSGLIPICSSCKKIRDDKGYWQQIELYISEHSNAEFTHGLCLDCAKRLYPDLYKDEE
ncbi:PAS domain-containing protein [Thermodesulfobacteriota bacterium]